MKSKPDRIDGQLDVFEVLDLVEKEGLVPQDRPKRKMHAMGELKWEIDRLEPYRFTVTIQYLGQTEVYEFYSQIECWAFVKGYERCLARLRG